MASAKVYNVAGTEVATVELSDAVFDAASNETIVHEVVLAYQNAQRQGNAETKTRSDVRGGGAKPFRQKGTGNARRGSTREPVLRGGGTVFGPHKRSYRMRVSLRSRRTALRVALSDRFRGECLSVCEGIACDGIKTKAVADVLTKLAPEQRRTLIVTADLNANLVKSASNLPRVEVRTASDVNALDVVTAHRVVVEQAAVAKLEERLS
jgi:large subunit ribosomal protein L4